MATMTVHFGSPDSTTSVDLSGTATVKPPKSVQEDASLAINVSMQPNPFAVSANIRLTAEQACSMGVVIHDALGHTVYTSDMRVVGAGATESFDFDAGALKLAHGVYYVTALFGDKQVTKQLVFAK
jgi:hypothetical protein